MKQPSEAYEMGWNDLLGNAFLRRMVERVPFANSMLKSTAFGSLKHQLMPEYKDGVHAACRAIIDHQPLAYKGPQHVVDDLNAKAPLVTGTHAKPNPPKTSKPPSGMLLSTCSSND